MEPGKITSTDTDKIFSIKNTDFEEALRVTAVPLAKLADWVITHKRSVFLEADISHEDKKAILITLGISNDVLGQ